MQMRQAKYAACETFLCKGCSMKFLPALIVLSVLGLGAPPASAQSDFRIYDASMPHVFVPGGSIFGDSYRSFGHRYGYGSASDCTFIGSPSPFEQANGRRFSYGRDPTTGMSAAEQHNYSYILSDFDPANPGGDPDRAEMLADTPGMRVMYDSFHLGCSATDRFEMQARARIARNDRTWQLATAALGRGDYPLAVELFQKGYSKVGVPEFAYSAAVLLYNGQGVPRDAARAIKLFDQIALARGTGRMRAWFDPAHPERTNASVNAMLALADIYLAGKDVEPDQRFARKLLQRAADAGYAPAGLKLARMLVSGPLGRRDYRRARRLLQDAAQANYAPAQFTLAQLLESGEGGAADPVKAVDWYRRAAFNSRDASRKAQAQYRLARMVDSGTGTERHPAKALELYRLAAREGHAEALGAVADYMYRGELVDKNVVQARRLYRAAAERGNADAMANLAALLYHGEGGQADPAEAYSWLLVADEAGHPDAAAKAKVVQASLTPEQRAKVEATLLPVLAR